MEYIKNRKHAPHHFRLPAASLITGLALGAPLVAHAALGGTEDAAAARPAGKHKVTLEEVTVEASGVYPATTLASPKFVRPIKDTPQTIQVIDRDLFNQQGATTLTEALRNSAGVGTFYAGENGSTSTGDALYLRGFDSSSSLFVDGVRDLGAIARDVFNIEQIEVVKGPAGTDNGRSAPSGAINLVSKQAQLRDAVSGIVSAGADGQRRATSDWSQTLGASAGLRVNAMWQDSDVPGRDRVNNSRWGVAPSLGLGIGTDTQVFLNLLYVKQNNVPDGFVPTIGLPGWEPQPGLAALVDHPVDSQNFYGTRLDHDNVTAAMATVKVEHAFSDTLSLTNTTRWGRTDQDYLLTSFMSTAGNIHLAPGGDPSDLSAYTKARTIPTLKDQQNRIWTNQLNLRADAATGRVLHSVSTGLELTRELQDAGNFSRTGSLSPVSLYTPDWSAAGDLAWSLDGTGKHGKTDTGALYLFDTLEFDQNTLVTVGLRADHYRTTFQSNAICNTPGSSGSGRGVVLCGDAPVGAAVETANLRVSDTLLNWKLGVLQKLTPHTSLYVNAAVSQQPPGGSNFQLSTSNRSADNPTLAPQKARTIEAGAKWTSADERLLLTAALFRTDVTNEINTQLLDEDGNPTQTGEKQVEGIELAMVGSLTEHWSISAGYSHQNAEVTEGAPAASDGTPNLTYTPGDAFTAWTSYHTSFGLTLGGGARYMDGLHRGTDGAVGTPATTEAYTVLDAVAAYTRGEHLTLRLNAYNLTNEHYVAAINKSGYRYVPGAPRSFLLSADWHF